MNGGRFGRHAHDRDCRRRDARRRRVGGECRACSRPPRCCRRDNWRPRACPQSASIGVNRRRPDGARSRSRHESARSAARAR
ncbi:hypothetical protein C7S16_4525 [Burkholderia thailandensis]|uniref:Uncharacterized protein n=1 Tax=Burkholderia thailandensis TaxID=57975 RepID=A0AAW9CQ40_BURTH|nr:hypothetical protein [Burkholderia thailandensis]MDW9252719.1 hypothetical protein [Burkholderia thailandensis]